MATKGKDFFDRSLIQMFIFAIVGIVFSTMSLYIYFFTSKGDILYEESPFYKTNNTAITSLKLTNPNSSDAEDVLIDISFPTTITDVQLKNSAATFEIISGGVGSTGLVAKIPRISPEQSVTIYFTIENKNNEISDNFAKFTNQIALKSGIGREKLSPLLSLFPLLITTLILIAIISVGGLWVLRHKNYLSGNIELSEKLQTLDKTLNRGFEEIRLSNDRTQIFLEHAQFERQKEHTKLFINKVIGILKTQNEDLTESEFIPVEKTFISDAKNEIYLTIDSSSQITDNGDEMVSKVLDNWFDSFVQLKETQKPENYSSDLILPSKETANRVHKWIIKAYKMAPDISAPEIVPDGEGEIDIEWETKDKFVTIHIRKDISVPDTIFFKNGEIVEHLLLDEDNLKQVLTSL